jgi:hypothetical protein
MFAIPIMMVRRAEVAKMGMMMMSKEKLWEEMTDVSDASCGVSEVTHVGLVLW